MSGSLVEAIRALSEMLKGAEDGDEAIVFGFGFNGAAVEFDLELSSGVGSDEKGVLGLGFPAFAAGEAEAEGGEEGFHVEGSTRTEKQPLDKKA